LERVFQGGELKVNIIYLINIILESKKEISGVILSGGKSIRMGKNKAFIQVEGVPIIERIHNLFRKLFREVIIVTNEKICFKFRFENFFRSDPRQRALGGLYTGIVFSSFYYSFCVACDMPFIKKSLVQY